MLQHRRAKAGAFPTLALATPILLTATPALAYVGPGAGLSVIGTVLALLAALGLAVVGFVWYPVKRLRQKKRRQENGALPRQDTQPSGQQ